jgi:hypothetical protein
VNGLLASLTDKVSAVALVAHREAIGYAHRISGWTISIQPRPEDQDADGTALSAGKVLTQKTCAHSGRSSARILRSEKR